MFNSPKYAITTDVHISTSVSVEVGNSWDSIRHLHPSPVGNPSPLDKEATNNANAMSAPNQGLSETKEYSLFLRQCNFNSMIAFLGFKDIDVVPVYLTSIASKFWKQIQIPLHANATAPTVHVEGFIRTVLKSALEQIGCAEKMDKCKEILQITFENQAKHPVYAAAAS